MIAVLSWLLVGFFVGWLARLVTGGGGPRGFFLTSLFGIAGSVAGTLVARQFHLPTTGAGGFLMSVIGASLLVLVLGFLARLTRR